MKKVSVLLVFMSLLAACSLPPDRPVTREDLMQTRIYSKFIIEESPEQVLNVLNREGEVVIDGKRNIPGKDYPVKVKLLATSDGIEISEYDQ